MTGNRKHPEAPAAVAAAALAAGTIAAVAGPAAAGTAPALAFTPDPGTYGNVAVGQTGSQTFMLANSGGRASGAITATVGGAGFAITADTCTGTSLGPGKSCTITVQFAPATPGTATATLTAAGQQATATDPLTGTGQAPAHLYWESGEAIWEANLDGSNPHTIIAGPLAIAGNAIAVGSSHIYFEGQFNGNDHSTIMEANLDGTGATTLVADTGQSGPLVLAVDGSRIYWASICQQSLLICGPYATDIMAANLDGTGVTELVDGLAGGNFLQTSGLALDSQHLYWTDRGSVYEANLDGSNIQSIDSLVGAQGLAVNSSHLYWADNGDAIDEANLDGTGVTTLVTDPNGPWTVAVDSSHVYWDDPWIGGTIMAANLDGTGVTTLATGQSYPWAVAVGPQ